jgi:probable HAF family extracellular repeat protein
VPAQYAVTDLGTLGGFYSSYAYDLNDAGQVVGHASTTNGIQHAFLWDNGTMIDLGTLGGSHSSATGINDLGQVVGTANVPGDAGMHAFLVTPSGGMWFQDSDLDGRNDFMIDLGTLNASAHSHPFDLNNAGQVVGGSGGHAFLWDAANGMTDLGLPVGFTYNFASDINESGQVTGSAYDSVSGQTSTILWDAINGMTALGAGPGNMYGRATGINDAGQLVGYSAFLWTPNSPNGLSGSFTDLGMLPDAIDSFANGLNNAGQVVGYCTVAEEFPTGGDPAYETRYRNHAFLWDAAFGMADLQNLVLYGCEATRAVAINDDGAIAVNGHINIPWLETDRAYLLTPIPPGTPSISIADAPAVIEGNAGTKSATFTVTLSAASTQTVTVAYASANGTAAAGGDYQAASGTLTFVPGETSKTVTVLVNGDRLPEPHETFVVNLSSPTNATIADSQGAGTIVDDEPRISISDVTRKEGKKYQTTLFTFTVTLSAAYDQPVTMSYRTFNGTAKTSNNDYVAKSGTLTFAPGETTKTITIEVKGDSKREANEYFYLDLFGNSSNSLFTRNRGLGTILNDD